MAKYHCIRTAKLTDWQVIDLIYALKDKTGLASAQLNFIGDANLEIVSLDIEDDKISKLRSDRHAILQFHLRTPTGIQVMLLRGICSDVERPISDRKSSAYFDELYLSADDRSQDPNRVAAIVDCIDAIEAELPKVFPISETERSQDVVDVIQAEVSALGAEYRKLVGAFSQERQDFRAEIEERRREFEQECAATREGLETAATREKEQLAEQRNQSQAEFREKELALKKREEDLDDRHHMHARRQLRMQISENLRKRIAQPVVSKRSSRIRWSVFALTLLSGLGIGFVALLETGYVPGLDESVLSLERQSLPIWSSISGVVRSSILLLLSVGFVAYAINWLRVCYLDDVGTERHFERYGNDIDRASFVIETIMEVGENVPVPNAWVEGVCRNLFSEKDADGYGTLPSGAMAMLLDVVSGAKFGPDGAEVSMGRRDARRAARVLRDGA